VDDAQPVAIEIASGTYHESLTLRPSRSERPAMLTIEAEAEAVVIVDGTERYRPEWHNEPTGAWSAVWPYHHPLSPDEWSDWGQHIREIARRRELVMSAGRGLTQVPSSRSLVPGTFSIDDALSRIMVLPSRVGQDRTLPDHPGDLAVSTIERLLECRGVRNCTISGLLFRGAMSPIPGAAVEITDCSDITLDNCTVEWNNWDGVLVTRSNRVTLSSCRMNHNGGSGLGYFDGHDVTIEGCETNANNTRGVLGGFTNWATGGAKILKMHNVAIRNHQSRWNDTLGFWLDWENTDVVISGLICEDNLGDGLMIEASQGPVELRDSEFRRNNRGVYVASTHDVTVERVVAEDNAVSQFAVFGDWGNGRAPVDLETGTAITVLPERIAVRSSRLAALGGELLFEQRWHDFGAGWNAFVSTFAASGNTYEYGGDAHKFCGRNSAPLSFEEWRREFGVDADSSCTRVESRPAAANGVRVSGPVATDEYGRLSVGLECPLVEGEEIVGLYSDPGCNNNVSRLAACSSTDTPTAGTRSSGTELMTWYDPAPGPHHVFAVVRDRRGYSRRTNPVPLFIQYEDRPGVLSDIWTSMPGDDVGVLVRETQSFALPARATYARERLGVRDDYCLNSGLRMRALLHPPESGLYRFTVRGGASCCLLVSTTCSPLTRRVVTSLMGAGDESREASSPFLELESGGPGLYLELLIKTPDAPSGLEVSWERPGLTRELIPEGAITVYVPA
jgi:parallel beta-helix repeat protein